MFIGYVMLTRDPNSPSGRQRGFNVIKLLNKRKGFKAEIYNPKNKKKYDVLVFIKACRPKDIKLAKEFKGLRVFDLSDNFLEKSSYTTVEEVERARKMTYTCDVFVAPSQYLADVAKQFNSNSYKIEDMIDPIDDTFVMVWHGLASNFKQVKAYEDVLSKLGSKYKLKLVAVADWHNAKNLPKIKNVKVEKVKWSQENLCREIKKADVCISPKVRNELYWEQGKSSNKILYPLKLGTKVVCSDIVEYVSVYKKFPEYVKLFITPEEFKFHLETMILEKKKRMDFQSNEEVLRKWIDVFSIVKERTPTVSVITAVYNAEKTLAQTIESVLSQTFEDFEYILVDDCSNDRSLQIMEEYARKDSRIKILKNKTNLKQAKTRNRAIRESKGKYIANIDSDDLMKKDKLEKQVKFMEKNPNVDICYTGYTVIDKDGNIISDVEPLEWDEERMLNKQNLLNNNTIMMRRGVFYDGNWEYADDYSTWLSALKVGKKIRPLKENLTYYRVYPESKWHSHLKECEEEKNAIIDYWKKFDVSKPIVSIIMPTYNRPRLIRKAIESVLCQTFPKFELVVVNDGGMNIQHLIDSYKDKRIKYINKNHGGLSSALNVGIRNAKGKYVAYLDDDDLLKSNHLEVGLKELEKGEVDLVYTICDRITAAGKFISRYDNAFNSEIMNYDGNLFPTCSVIHKKELIEKCGWFDESLPTHMDWDMWKKFVKSGVNFKHIPIHTSYYVIHGNNMLKKNVEANDKDREIVRRR